MRLRLILVLGLLLINFTMSVMAAAPAPKTVIAEGIYQAGDNDAPVVAQEAALLLAKRSALEQCGTFVTSSTTVQNFIVKDDTVRSLAAGVMDITILDKKRTPVGNGIEFYVKIQATVYPEKLNAIMKQVERGGSDLVIQPLSKKRVFTADIEMGNSTMNHLLIQGITSNNFERVQQAIAGGANVNIYTDYSHNNTPLTLAFNNLEIMEYLIKVGAAVNIETSVNGWPGAHETPLMLAIEQKNQAAVELLLSYEADYNYADPRGFRAIDRAIEYSVPMPIVKTLLSMPGIKLNYNVRFNNNPTPIMMAIHKGNPELVRLLLVAGADPKRSDVDGKNGLDQAISSGNDMIIKMLM